MVSGLGAFGTRSTADRVGTPHGWISELGEVVGGCQRGESRSWQQLIGAYNPVIWSVVRSFRLSDQDCEDVCQLVWMRCVEQLPRLREPGCVRAWLVTVAKREAIKCRNRSQRLHPVADVPEGSAVEADADDPEELALWRVRAREAFAAFRELPVRQRELLSLVLADHSPSYDVIAARLGVSRGSIGPTRQRALSRLRRKLAGQA